MKDLDYNEYLFAIFHFEAFVKNTDTPLDDAFECYLTKYQKYLKSDVSKNYSLSDYEAMTRFIEQEV